MKEHWSSLTTSIHKEGWIFAAIFAGITILAGYLWWPLWFVGGLLTAWCLYFFRDPTRVTPRIDNAIVSPADGIITQIGMASPPPEMGLSDDRMLRICVFMNVFNVHVNRNPVSGVVRKVHYRPGKFFNASLDKASTDNERTSILIERTDGTPVVCVQIAGLIARRIVCYLKLGDPVTVGKRFGLIRFGSRVDVYMPEHSTPTVCKGQIAVAGETILAKLPEKEASATSSKRTLVGDKS